jgi:putative membrane protein
VTGPETGRPATGDPETGDPETGDPETDRPETGGPAADGSETGRPATGDPETGGPAVAADDFASWRRLHPLSPVVGAGRQLMSIVFLVLVIFIANHHGEGGDLIVNVLIVGVVLAGGLVSWLVTRWQVADGVLRIETGLVRRQSRRFPLSQVQAIDVVQTGLARVLGLAELRLRMAGADSSGGRLASLPLAQAQQLRYRLLSMARAPGAVAAGGPAAAAGPTGRSGPPAPDRGPERLLFRVQPVRLAGAIILSRTGAIAGVVIAAVASVVAVTGHVAVVAPFLTLALGLVLTVWRQFNSEYGTAVAAAADGLRLRSGLVQTTAETIRPGRVQAVRLVQPLVWRPLGWCRLEVDVAGPRQRRENQSESQRLRALIPVGSRSDAEQMIGELLSTQPAPTQRAPRSARWKAPLTYHFLAWGSDDRYVVAARGRVCQKTTWVPLEKVQSVRWVQGPVQRRLGLASVRLDVAGKRVTASIEDRDAAEAAEILGRLPGLARSARTRGQAS